MRKLLLIIFLGSLLFPSVSLADGVYFACKDVNKNWICEDTETDRILVYYQGLVPCGKAVCKIDADKIDELKEELDEGAPFEDACRHVTVGGTFVAGQILEEPATKEKHIIGVPCQFCHFFVMLDGIIDFILFKIVPPLAVLFLVIGGIMMMFAHFGGAEALPGGVKGGPAMLSKAKKLMTSVVIGLVIIFAAYIIIGLFFRYIGVTAWTGLEGGWFSINCPVAVALP